MHQHLRQTAKAASSGKSSPSDASSTSEQRGSLPNRSRSSVDLTQYTEPPSADAAARAVQQRPQVAAQEEREQTKLNQIIQNFYTKAALTICSSRSQLSRVYTKAGDLKQNRWFNLILDDTHDIYDALSDWRRSDLAENRPFSLILEVYADPSLLAPGQALVITDTTGKRWNTAESLSTDGSTGAQEVLLESWNIQLGDAEGLTPAQLNDQLPNVYKKGVVLFRSLYTFLRLLPTWKLYRRLGRQTGGLNALSIGYRLKRGPWGRASARQNRDSAFPPLCQTDLDTQKVTGSHSFESLVCPAGPLQISIQYRYNVNLSVADSEALLSSRFAGLDAASDRSMYGRSLPGQRSQGDTAYGSIGASRNTDSAARLSRVAGGGAYGSLGTFHAAGKRESPVTVLRQRALSQEQDQDAPGTLSRRPSVAGDSSLLRNPPFKAGSYATSPRGLPTPSTSAPRPSVFGSSAPKRLSLNTLPQQALRAPGSGFEHAIASSGSASPKPAPVHRYSSSFANRKRFTSHSSSKTGESATSSGRNSEESKERSGQLEEGNTASSGSGRTDEDDIAAFISTVEQAKTLPSFATKKRPGSTSINLSKFKGMGIASAELADEMSSSSLVQNSLTPPSRRLSNVPGLSTSSSPGRAFAHAPHVRSRLSTHSIAEVRESETSAGKAPPDEPDDGSSDDEPFIFQQDNIL